MECYVCGTKKGVKVRDDGLPYCNECWQDMLEDEEEEEEEELGDEEDEDY